MIVVPQRGDQHLVGARIAELGAGLAIPAPRVTPELLRSAAAGMLGDAAFRSKAKLLGQSLRNAGGPSRAADVIRQYARREARTASCA
jgi:UDP:flavonoid glycosyltransferase YjiC (YdhE family)